MRNCNILETLLILSVLSFLLINCAPTRDTADKDDKAAAKSYLRKYGHIDKDSDDNITDSDLDGGLISFQNFNGLPATGVLDAATKAQMAKSRCGLPDKVKGQSNSHRSRRYVLGGQWSTRTLTYYLQNGPVSGLTQTQVAAIINRAYKFWTDAACLFITPSATSTANLQLSFRTYDHGDGYPFDGPLKVLAHAFYPSDGRLHFDDSETWTTATTTGINLLQVAVHEIGHQLGLGHSSVLSAVMYPYYNGYLSNFALDPDDIAGMRALYGLCPQTTTTPKPTTTVKQTTVIPTTVKPTTVKLTTVKATTVKSTTVKPTTVKATTVKPTTVKPTTVKATTVRATTVKATTVKPTTVKPTTVKATTVRATTAAKVTTVKPTTKSLFCIQP